MDFDDPLADATSRGRFFPARASSLGRAPDVQEKSPWALPRAGHEAAYTLNPVRGSASPRVVFRLGEVEWEVVHWLLAVEGDHIANPLIGFQDLHSPLAQLV